MFKFFKKCTEVNKKCTHTREIYSLLLLLEPVPTPVPVPNVRPPQGPVPPPAVPQAIPPRVTPGMAPNIGPAGASDQEKVTLLLLTG